MAETPGMRALLDLEDGAPDVLRTVVPATGDAFWPLLRWPLTRVVAEADINTVVTPGRRTRLQAVAGQIRTRMPSRHSSDARAVRAEHLFVVHGGTRIPGATGTTNWLVDDFAEALAGDASVIQDLAFDRWTSRAERPRLERTFTFAPALARVEYLTRVSPLSTADASHLGAAVDRVFDALPFEVPPPLRDRARGQALRRAARTPHIRAEFARLLERAQPRRIFMQTAAYGDRSPMIRLAHEAGIPVAELQHGWIGASHAAYNWGAIAKEPIIAAALPDTLLTFGEYWGENIRFPGRVVPIGKPQTAAISPPPIRERPTDVLVVSSNFETEALVRVVNTVVDLLPETWSVVLRPHPAERHLAADRYSAALTTPRVRLDLDPDVNVSLGRTRGVIGFASTVLFEALPYASPIGVIASGLADHYAPRDVFPTRLDDAASIRRFIDAVISPAPTSEHATGDLVWQPDPLAHFLQEAAR